MALKLIPRSEWGARAPRATTATDDRLRGLACHWEGPRMGVPVHANAAADRPRLAVGRIAEAIATLHRTHGEEHHGDHGLVVAGLTPPTVAEYESARDVVAAADCYGLVAGIQAFHMDTRGWNDIAYNGVVCPHGFVFVGRGPGLRNGANGDAAVNASHYALCYLGGEGDPFSDAGRDGFEAGYRWLLGTDDLAAYEWAGHSDLTATACPGPEILPFAHGPHPWRGGTADPDPEVPQEDSMGFAYTVTLDLARGEQAREVGLPAPKGSGHVRFGEVRGSFSVGEFPKEPDVRRVGLVVVKHRNDGSGVGVPHQDAAGVTWVPVASGRHGEFFAEPGEESVQVALADDDRNPPHAVVDLLFEIGPAPQ